MKWVLFIVSLSISFFAYAIQLKDIQGHTHDVTVDTMLIENGKPLPSGTYSIHNGKELIVKDGKVDVEAMKAKAVSATNGIKLHQPYVFNNLKDQKVAAS